MTKSPQRHYKSQENKHPNRCVLWRLQKTSRNNVMARQSVPGTSNGDRNSSISDMFDRRVRRTGSDDVDIDRRRDLISGSQGWKSSSTRYCTSVPFNCSVWKSWTASLYRIRSALSANVADEWAEWWGRTWTTKTLAIRQSLEFITDWSRLCLWKWCCRNPGWLYQRHYQRLENGSHLVFVHGSSMYKDLTEHVGLINRMPVNVWNQRFSSV